ncbi:MAG: hypothetical protein O2840_02870 [bacterium]|nr:hypothetical protein [bacterium]
MLATTTAELPNAGLEWFLDHIRQFLHEFPNITIAADELLRQVLDFLEKSLSTLVALAGEYAIGPLQQEQMVQLTSEIRDSVLELAKDTEQHALLITVFLELENDLLGTFDFAGSGIEQLVPEVEKKLNRLTIFQLMSTMIAGPESRHRGTNPTSHTARVILEWFREAQTRFPSSSLQGESVWAFREELLAVMLHDLGKVLNPRFDGHHKISWTLAWESVRALFAHFNLETRSDDKVNFMISMHDICGHIAAGRMKYVDVLEDFSRVGEDYMLSLFYVQLADISAIKAMPLLNKYENLTIWAMLCFDLGFDHLIDEMVVKFPQFTDILNRRFSFTGQQ